MNGLAVASLAERRVLVVEDEYMIADEIASVLGEAGAIVIGPAASVDDGLALLATQERLDGALLDVNLHGRVAWPIVDALLKRGVPVVITTGYDDGAIPPAYTSLPRCEKPTTGRDVMELLQRTLKQCGSLN